MTTSQTLSSVGSLTVDAPRIILGDAFEWLEKAEPNSIHAVVTDPPYGLVEYTPAARKAACRSGRCVANTSGVRQRRPQALPRFTVLNDDDKERLKAFFERFAALLMPVLVPGAHVFIATNPLVSQVRLHAFIRAGFEKRGEIVRVVQTLRGGDRPKNAHEEFPSVSVNAPLLLGTLGTVFARPLRRTCSGTISRQVEDWRTNAVVRR